MRTTILLCTLLLISTVDQIPGITPLPASEIETLGHLGAGGLVVFIIMDIVEIIKRK